MYYLNAHTMDVHPFNAKTIAPWPKGGSIAFYLSN